MPARLAALVLLEIAALVYFTFALVSPGAPVSAASGDASLSRTTHDAEPASPARANAAKTSAADTSPAAAPVRSAAAAKWSKDDPVGVLLTGTVRWRDGEPVAEPSVHVRLGDAGLSASTDAKGCFAVVGLSPGTWTAKVRADGGIDAEETLEVTDDAEQRHEFVLDRSYPVRVFCTTPDGKDLAKALAESGVFFFDLNVIGRREPFPDRLAPTDYGSVMAGDAKWESQRAGRGAKKTDDSAGTLHFAAPPPAHAALMLRHVVVQQQRIEAGQKEVRFVVDPADWKAKLGTVTLRIVDADSGAPLPDATVSLNTSSTGGGGKKCDAEGRVTLTGAQPGLLFLEVWAKDREQVRTTIRVEPGQSIDLGDVRVGPGIKFAGRVEDANGKPVTDASVSWTELKWRTTPTEFARNRTARVDSDGTFSVWGTGRGKIAVRASTKDGDVACSVFDNPPANPVVLRMVRGTKLSLVRNDDPTRAFTVTLFDAQRQPLDSRTLEARWPKQTLTLPPGPYTFEVNDETDRLVQSGSITLGGEPATLEVR